MLVIRGEGIGRAYGIIYISSSCTDVRAEVDRPVDRERVMTKTEEFHSLV